MRRLISAALALLFGISAAYADTGSTTTITAGPGAAVTAATSFGGPITVGLFDTVNAVGTNGGTHAYTLLAADYGKFLTFTDASAFALTLPVGSTTGFGTGYFFTLTNYGAGTITATPTTSTINNGGSSLTLAQNTQCTIFLDAAGTPNYQLGPCSAVAPSGSSGFPITLCATSVANGSTNVTLTGCTLAGTTAVTGALNVNPANANVSLAPTGTGIVTINPATASAINNESIGQSTPLAGSFTTASITTPGPVGDLGIAANRSPDNVVGSVGWVDDTATNLALGSDVFANATYWSQGAGLVATANSIESPNGGTNATLETSQASGTQSITSASAAAIVSGSTYTQSIYIKAGSGVTWIDAVNQNTGVTKLIQQWWNISTCTVGTNSVTSATFVSASGYSVGNGWCRFSVSFSYADVTNKTLFQAVTTNGGLGAPANGSTFYIWGNDLTLGATVHSHIPTLAATITTPAGLSAAPNLIAYGHEVSFQTALPTVSSCGTGSPTVTAGSTDLRGSVTTGSAATTCTISFGLTTAGQAFLSAPVCIVSDSSSTIPVGISSISTSAFVTTMGALTAGTIYWICIG